VLRVVVLLVIALPWVLVPMWLLLVNSVKPYSEASTLGLGLPHEWRFDNFAVVAEKGNYLAALLNSLLIAVPTLACVLLFGSMAAWAYAR
jgi:raffinose/stachyose/melibiose transport system permease protein